MENETLNNQTTETAENVQDTPNTATAQAAQTSHTAQYATILTQTRSPRRVGTTTLGFCLVGLGIILLMGFFMKNNSLLLLLKLSPVVLIFLGCEILFYSLVSGREKLKYDGLSIFLCFLLVLTSLGISTGLQVAGAFGFTPERYMSEQRLQNQLENVVCDALAGVNNIASVKTNLYTDGYFDYENAEVNNLRGSGADCYINIRLAGDYTDTKSFAQSVNDILKKLGTLTNQFESLRVETQNEKASFDFAIDGRFLGEQTVENIEKMVQADFFVQEETPESPTSEITEEQIEA